MIEEKRAGQFNAERSLVEQSEVTFLEQVVVSFLLVTGWFVR